MSNIVSAVVDGRELKIGDEISISGRKGEVWKFYKADGIVSMAIKYPNNMYEMFLIDNVVLD